MQVQENFPLRPYNSFGINAHARAFASVQSLSEVQTLLNENHRQASPLLILGGGSNMLLTKDVDVLVVKNDIRGIRVTAEDDQYVYVRAGAGENWHQFVLHTLQQGWGGIENLSLIPGNVGASPMQNIGAYGVEIKDVFHELTAFHLSEKANYTFKQKDCMFGYRESVFKNKYKDQFIIIDVTFRLHKRHTINTSYGAIAQELEKMNITDPTITDVSNAVINIRRSKLPNPAQIGNAGSFFKNPSVSAEKFAALKATHQNIIGYPNPDGTVKLAAGWLIEHSGPNEGQSWKGFREGDAGVHALQALVLVNYGDAKGQEIYDLSERIMQSVVDKFDVQLTREVNII